MTLDGAGAPDDGSSKLPSPTVHGDNVAFISNEVTNRHTAICFAVGNESLRPRLQRRDPRQPHPRLRRAAAHQPPARHLPPLAVLRAGDRQLDPRQRGHGREPVPERRRQLLRPERDPRQRRQPELRRAQQGRRLRVVRQQPDREQRHDVPARAQEHHLLVAAVGAMGPATSCGATASTRPRSRAPRATRSRTTCTWTRNTSTPRTPTSGCGPAVPCAPLLDHPGPSGDGAAAGAGNPPGCPADRTAVRRLAGSAAGRQAGRRWRRRCDAACPAPLRAARRPGGAGRQRLGPGITEGADHAAPPRRMGSRACRPPGEQRPLPRRAAVAAVGRAGPPDGRRSHCARCASRGRRASWCCVRRSRASGAPRRYACGVRR